MGIPPLGQRARLRWVKRWLQTPCTRWAVVRFRNLELGEVLTPRLLQVSHKLQGQLQEECNWTRRAKRDLINTTNTQPQTKNYKSGLLTQSDKEEDGIAKATKKFTIMHLFWLHQDRQMFQSKPNKQHDHLQHFENDNNKIQGQLADLLEFLPSTFMDDSGWQCGLVVKEDMICTSLLGLSSDHWT